MDAQLVTAQRNLQSLDRAIGKLCDKFGDRVDGRADYIEAEERWFAALKSLATIQARSPDGMIAKARALQAVSVTDDLDRKAAIATSLADDLLQHFRRAA